MNRLTIDIVREGGDWGMLEPIEPLVERVAQGLCEEPAITPRLEGKEVCLALCDDAIVARLNAQFRSKAAATNVLSFPASPVLVAQGQLGDIAMAIETLAREAQSEDIPLAHHVQHLLVHGVLHLLGYDHENDATAGTMEALEVKVLARLGVPDPYTDRA